MTSWVGKFLGAPSGVIDWQRIESRHDLGFGWRLKPTGNVFDQQQWHSFDLSTDDPLLSAEPLENDQAAVFTYPLLVVRGVTNFIILAPQKNISEYFERKVLTHALGRSFSAVNINIDSFVDECISDTPQYAMTNLHGRYAGNTRAVSSMSLYGSDVGSWQEFRGLRKLFNFVTMGAASISQDRFLPIKREIGRLGNDGSVQASVRNQEDSIELLKLIQHTVVRGWVPDWARDGYF